MSTATAITVSAPPPIPERPAVRCFYCHLVQFANEREVCRRCRKKYFYEPEPDPPPPVVTATPSLCEATLRYCLPDVGAAVKFARSMRGLSQAGLARKMQTRFRDMAPRTYISKVENHQVYEPTISTLDNFARGLGIPVYWLLLMAESFK